MADRKDPAAARVDLLRPTTSLRDLARLVWWWMRLARHCVALHDFDEDAVQTLVRERFPNA